MSLWGKFLKGEISFIFTQAGNTDSILKGEAGSEAVGTDAAPRDPWWVQAAGIWTQLHCLSYCGPHILPAQMEAGFQSCLSLPWVEHELNGLQGSFLTTFFSMILFYHFSFNEKSSEQTQAAVSFEQKNLFHWNSLLKNLWGWTW